MLTLALAFAPWAARAAPALSPVAPAHDLSVSTWVVEGASVHLRFSLPVAQVPALVAPAQANATTAAAAVAARVAVSSSAGDCPAIIQNEWVGKIYTLAPIPGLHRFEMTFACPSADGLVLHDHVLFDRQAGHLNYARVQIGGGQPRLMVFTAQHQELAATGVGAPANGSLFAGRGLASVLHRLDALCLAGGLLLLARRWRDLADIALALGVGYLASLGIALSGLVSPDFSLSGAAVGVLAVVLGASALREKAIQPARGWRIAFMLGAILIGALALGAAAWKGAPAGLAAGGLAGFALAQVWIVGQAPRLRALVFAPAALFGLLDGMDQAGDLALLQLPAGQSAPALLGHDLGALTCIIALVAGAMALFWLARRRLAPARGFAAEVAAAALIGLGLFWFVSRLYSV